MPSSFRAAHASGTHWGLVAKSCLDQLGPMALGDTLGLLYVTEGFSGDLPSILTFLRETTHIAHWVGGVASGICASGVEYYDDKAIVVLTGRLNPEHFRLFSGIELDETWIVHHTPPLCLVHADPHNPSLPRLLSHLAETLQGSVSETIGAPGEPPSLRGGFMLGGITSSVPQARQIADEITNGGLSGLLLSPALPVAVGLSQGCSPIGPAHMVTEGGNGVLISLDGRPALDVLKEEAGDLIARDLTRAAGYIHIGLPIEGSDRGDYTVRNLIGIDTQRGWIGIAATGNPGERVIFVRRDSNAAQEDLRRMTRQTAARARANGGISAGLYVSCVARGPHMFGEVGHELSIIREELGDLPLIGFYANGEICNDRLYSYSGVLTLIS